MRKVVGTQTLVGGKGTSRVWVRVCVRIPMGYPCLTLLILLTISLISSLDIVISQFNIIAAHLGHLSCNPYSVKTHDFGYPPRGMGYDRDRVDCSTYYFYIES